VWVTSSLTTALTPTTVALGNFDGVHRGHCRVIAPIVSAVVAASPPRVLAGTSVIATEPAPSGSPNDSGLVDSAQLAEPECDLSYPTVLTFHPHPQEFFTGQPRLLLTPPDQKVARLKQLGIEQLILLPFDQSLAALSPQAFVETILVQQLQATKVSVGENFRFGYQRAGTAFDLQALCEGYGIDVHIVPLETIEHERISSSIIRQALQDGEVERANRLLGYSYALTGTVIKGQQLGARLGFPTANLEVAATKFLPRRGVYAVRVSSSTFNPPLSQQLGVMNLGVRPTVDGTQQTVEIHLLAWSGDLYEHTLNVSLEQFLRPEQTFASLDELKAQIQTDCAIAKIALTSSKSG
jgi:riboflavin kinase / FMN adenylyltransferase